MPEQRFGLNGRPVVVQADDDMPLLWVLRDRLNLTGTKFGCGQGLCRSCTVHLDGRATPACLTPIGTVRGEVTTIEGLAAEKDHPVLDAWEAEQVPQCGWCQPGQIMEAAALLARVPQPDDAAIHEAMNTHLCRCGTYGRIKKAISRAAASGRSLPVAAAPVSPGADAPPKGTP